MNTEDNTTEFDAYIQSSVKLTTAIMAFEQLLDVIDHEHPYHPLLEVHCGAISDAHQSLLSCFSYRFERIYQHLDKIPQNGSQFRFGPFEVIQGGKSVNPIKTV